MGAALPIRSAIPVSRSRPGGHIAKADRTRERVASAIDYDPATGTFTRRWDPLARLQTNARYAGKPAGTITSGGSLSINIDGKQYQAHRLAWLLQYGSWPESDIDHRDRNRLNNKIENLRLCTHQQNMCNRKHQKNNKSGFRGVYKPARSKFWLAQIKHNRKKTEIGRFATPEEAAAAYDAAARKMHGQFARLNFAEAP